MSGLEEDLEVAYLRLMTEDIGNDSTLAFRNAISVDVAKYLARALVKVTLAVLKDHDLEVDDDV